VIVSRSVSVQELGFFDTSKVGDITSRLSADTTTVSDQICLNANVFVRSVMQSCTVLVFMLSASWRLTVVTFILVPVNLQVRVSKSIHTSNMTSIR
jgi:ATP-binding cassette, subfamily B (MDR/TAP), member 9